MNPNYSLANPQWVDSQDMQQWLKISADTIAKYVAGGKIQVSTFSGKLYYNKTAAEFTLMQNIRPNIKNKKNN